MSDVDNSAALAPNSESVATTPVVEQPVPTPGPVDTTAGLPDPALEEGQEPPEKTRDRKAERRISKLTQKYEESQREIGRLQGLMEARATTAKPADANDGKPHESQFRTFEEFRDALDDWRIEQKLAAREAKASEVREQQSARQTAQQAHAQRAQTVVDKIKEAGKDIDGFDDVIETITSDGFRISSTMRDFLGESDHPALLAQWLADNPEDAARIASLESGVATEVLKRQEAKLASKPAARSTRTPAPPPTLGGRGSPQVDLSKITNMDEWAKVRGYN